MIKSTQTRWKKGTDRTFGYFTYKDNSMYTGDIRNDMPDGRGLLNFKNGGKYLGEFKQGKRHGMG